MKRKWKESPKQRAQERVVGRQFCWQYPKKFKPGKQPNAQIHTFQITGGSDSRARDVIHTTGKNVCMHVNFALASFVLQCFFPRFYRYVLCSFNNTNTHRTATLYFSVILCLAYRQGGKKFPFSVSLTVSIRELKVYFWIAI